MHRAPAAACGCPLTLPIVAERFQRSRHRDEDPAPHASSARRRRPEAAPSASPLAAPREHDRRGDDRRQRRDRHQRQRDLHHRPLRRERRPERDRRPEALSAARDRGGGAGPREPRAGEKRGANGAVTEGTTDGRDHETGAVWNAGAHAPPVLLFARCRRVLAPGERRGPIWSARRRRRRRSSSGSARASLWSRRPCTWRRPRCARRRGRGRGCGGRRSWRW